MEGTLERAGLTQVLHGFRSGRRTGVLHLAQNGATTRVYFKNGDIVFASSDDAAKRIGEILVRHGKISRDDLELALKVRESSKLRMGKTLIDMGYVSESELDTLVKSQVESILHSMLDWDRGSYRAELLERPLQQVDEDLLRTDISTENVLLASVRGVDDIDAIRAGIGDLHRSLRFSRAPDWIGKNLTLTPEEGFVLSRVDGDSSAADIAQLSPMGEIETLRCICALILAGVLELESTSVPFAAPQPVRQPAPAPAQTEATKPAEPVPVAAPPKPAPTPAPPAPPPQPSKELTAAAERFRQEMIAKHGTMRAVNHYELLEVGTNATHEQIKAGYFRLAKRLHPDHRAGLKIDDPDGIFDDLYLGVKAAYEVLASETSRRRYDFSLERTRPKTPTVAAEPPPSANTSTRRPQTKSPTAPPPTHYDARQMARLHFSNGQRFFEEGQFHEAIRELEDAVRLDGGRPEYHRLLGNALIKNPKWRRRAEAEFLKVLEIDRFDINTMLALGEIYEAGGMERRAKKMYEEALGLDPGNQRAIEKLDAGRTGNAMDKLKDILHRGKGH